MNKKELVQTIAKNASVTVADAEKCLGAFMNNIEKALARGDKITLVGFGAFETKRRNARDGRNPKTGETIYIPSTKVINFKAGKKIKQIINKI
tara:strand:+ start:170 stop:448 length:279 start_codon:yes stop_codon:yes gene_type:complete